MRTYKIDVDEEIWNFLQTKAEPFIDTPNSVLRRLLLGKTGSRTTTVILEKSELTALTFRTGVPKALSQILEVVYEVKAMGRSRNEATNIVAQRRGTAPQTIIDKYCRQLSKRAHEIDELLEEAPPDTFRGILEKKFPNFVDVIENFFNELDGFRPLKGKPSTSRLRDSRPAIKALSGETYGIEDFDRLDLGINTKPQAFQIDGETFSVSNWTELCEKLVAWLYENGHLELSDVPIMNHAERDKYFINSEPRHLIAERDAQWKQVGFFYVDTKYNANAHVKNILHTFNELQIGSIDFRITFE